MKPRSLILIALMMIVPLGALTWAITRIAENEKVVVRQQFHDLLVDRLQDVNGNITSFFEAAERDLVRITTVDRYGIDTLRQINRTEPRLQQLFVLTAEGGLTFPDPAESTSPLSLTERSFLFDAAKMFIDQDLRDMVIRTEQNTPISNNGMPADKIRPSFRSSSRAVLPQAQSPVQTLQQQETFQQVQNAYQQNTVQSWVKFEGSSGWFNWYWDRGVNLIYWQRRPSGHIVGGVLERARWIADLIAELPDTVDGDGDRAINTRIRLINESGDSVYQWGQFEPADDVAPFCEVPVTNPLESWRLQCFVSNSDLTTGTTSSAWLSMLTLLTAVSVVLGVCGFLFVREYARDMRDATQQVSFVNQVSHELKTPLTNIRMYAELLERDLEEVESTDVGKPRERLSVILSEGQRLSRLIGNVLTFARQKRQTLQLQARTEHPGRLIQQIVERFRPAFADQEIQIKLDCEVDRSMVIDPDFVEQILGNLISNVEKYAASGGLIKVSSSIEDDLLTINVEDRGPGIDASKSEEVFQPFARVSNNLSYAAGTGIGLPIARELARLHGGDLILRHSSAGCWFQATIRDQS